VSTVGTYAIGVGRIESVDEYNVVPVESTVTQPSPDITWVDLFSGYDKESVWGSLEIEYDVYSEIYDADTVISRSIISSLDAITKGGLLEALSNGTATIIGAIGVVSYDALSEGTAATEGSLSVSYSATLQGLSSARALLHIDSVDEDTVISRSVLLDIDRMLGVDSDTVYGVSEIDSFEFGWKDLFAEISLTDSVDDANLQTNYGLFQEIGGSTDLWATMDQYAVITGVSVIDSIDTENTFYEIFGLISGTSSLDATPVTEEDTQGSSDRYVWLNLVSNDVVGEAIIERAGYPTLINAPVFDTKYAQFRYSISSVDVHHTPPNMREVISGSATMTNNALNHFFGVNYAASGRARGNSNLQAVLTTGSTRYHEDSLDVFTVCTSATRPIVPGLGDTIYETDTELSYMWDGADWIINTPDGVYGPLSPTGPTGPGVYR